MAVKAKGNRARTDKGGIAMMYYVCLVAGVVIGWVMCAIFTVGKCGDCYHGQDIS